MKPVFICFCILFFSYQANSQKNAPIQSGPLIKMAEQLYDSGAYKKSLSLYENIDRNDTNYVKSLYGRALVLEADSQYNKAITLCEEALKLRDQRELEPDIYNLYGNLLNNTGQRDKSIVVFNEAIRKYPSYSLLYFNKGLTFFDQERYVDAESIFKEALLINPYQYSAHFYLGLCAIHQGKIVPAYLSFVGYILIYPDGKYSQRCIKLLAAISNAKDDILDYKTKRTAEGDENYALTEDILLSKIALEKEYKLQVSLDDAIFRQIQVVFEKLEYKEEDPDFWMQYYVPYYKKLYNESRFEPFIFWTFENVQIKEIQDYNKKNKKTIDNFTGQTADYFNLIRATRQLSYSKRAGQQIRYLYINGIFAGKGELTKDGKNYTGSWTFNYPQGNIKSTGQFNESGKDGKWTYYYFSGNLEGKEIYRNGKLDGEQLYYSNKGIMTSDESYQNNQKDGLLTSYYTNGRIFSTTMYKSGKKEGEYIEYYSGGQQSIIKRFTNDVETGPYTAFYTNGQLKESGTYLNGAVDGSYKEFHENGQISSEGMVKNNIADGEWKTYYENGKLKTRTNYVNKKPEGIQEEFYEDGQLKSTYTYKKGLLSGESVSYDKDQKPYARFQFSNNILESAVYLDKSGKQISSSVRKNNRLDLDMFQPDGTKITHRLFDEKGKPCGTETAYYYSGKISQVNDYLDGEKNGASTYYFPNGNKKTVQSMKNDKQDGLFTSYYPNGKIESEGWYTEGQAVGLWNYYDELGNLTTRNYLLNGVLSGYKTEYYTNGKIFLEKKFYKGLLEELKQFDTTGKLLVYDSFPQHNGKYLLLFPNGNKMQECNYVKGAFDGRLTKYNFDGSIEFIQYYKGGLLDSNYISYNYHNVKNTEGQYRAGKKTGLWKYYTEEGRLESTVNYADDEFNGSRKFFGDDNKVIGDISYRHDLRNGSASSFDPDGSLSYTVRYDEGEIKGYVYLDKDSKPVPEIPAEHGKLRITSFFQNGRPSRQCQYVDFSLNGTDILYYANGKIRSQDSSEYGIVEGLSKEYYPNGNPKKVYNFHNDRPHGRCLEYNEKGILVREINFYNGIRQGESKYYSENGGLLETRYYYNGSLLAVKK